MTASAQIKPAGSINHIGVEYVSPSSANNIEIYDDADIGGTANRVGQIDLATATLRLDNSIYIDGLSTALGASISFVPVVSASGSMTASSATGGSCKYWKMGGKLRLVSIYITDLVIGGTPSTEVRLQYPFTADGTSYGGGCIVGNPTSNVGFYLANSSTTMGFRKLDQTSWATGSGNDIIAQFWVMEA